MAMQIYADVLNMPVHIADGRQGGALGAACFAAVAAGKRFQRHGVSAKI